MAGAFDADGERPDERDDGKGSIFFILDGVVVRLNAGQAVIRLGYERRRRYVRHPLPTITIPLWRLGES
ncbi:MAG: hypothetical protein ACREGL_11490 [Alphaproteobacteria bacterium]